MKLSDFEMRKWVESGSDDTEKFMKESGYEIDKKYGCTIGFGLSMIVYKHIEDYDRVYELVVNENGSLIEFYSICDEWQFLLEYLPKIKQYWDGH